MRASEGFKSGRDISEACKRATLSPYLWVVRVGQCFYMICSYKGIMEPLDF